MASVSNPALYQEYPDPADEAILKKLIPLITDTIEKSYDSGLTYRDTHSKGHAAVRAEFIVEPGLPADLAIGLFATPKTYPCWVRFSNLNPTPQSDMIPDARACGIKLMGVEGDMLWSNEPAAKTLDFLMMGTPAFLAPNLSAFYDFQVALNRRGWRMAWYFASHLSTTMTIQDGSKPTPSLLEIEQWSQTAYALGDKAVQYYMRPCTKKQSPMPDIPNRNFLRERLAADLEQEHYDFDFMVRIQTDPVKQPIENPRVRWPALSPYRKVATLRFLRQKGINESEQVFFCENLSFNPWRTLKEHRPLGGINRARRFVYEAVAEFRRARNLAPPAEPTPDSSKTVTLLASDGALTSGGNR
jgi:hypothetical protein